jgi:exonuclease III
MTSINKKWPSVPSSSGTTSINGSRRTGKGAEGAKNLWVRTGCHWNIKIGTFNARSLSSDDRFTEFENELERIKFEIIGISETRRKGEGCLTLSNSGHQFYYKGGTTAHRGVGFIVHRSIAGNVTSFKGVSDRVAQLTIRINSKYHLNIIQVYMPTSSHTDEEIDAVYEDVDNLINNNRAHFNVIMGDFNAKIGIGDPSESSTGSFGSGTRNSRGDSLINFTERHRLKIMNTYFKKREQRRWTWISPNGDTKNEIDYIITDKPQIVTDVSVLNSFKTSSDHRMVRASLAINTKRERARLVRKPKKPNPLMLSEKAKEFQLLLTNKFQALESSQSDDTDLSTYCDNLTTTIMESAMETAGHDKPPKPDKLSVGTKQLLAKRRLLKRGGTNIQHIEYTEICKAIRRRIKEDINRYNDEQQLKALEDNKGLKSVKRKQYLGTNNIITLKEEDGTLIHDLEKIVKRCEEFYTKLYSTRQPQDQPFIEDHENAARQACPAILPAEVREAIKQLKRDKAPGEDNITAGILQDGGEPIVSILTKLYNRCLSDGQVPNSWKNASVVIIHKKGDTADIKNYRPISLLPVTYKIFSQILMKRMLQTLDSYQPREQAGFRRGFSTIDHIQVIGQIQEKAKEYKMPLCLGFIDYEKAFDSIEFTPMFNALKNQGIDPEYITLLQDLYSGATATLKLHRDSDSIKLERGARQGDNISPKLFTGCLQDAVISKINWEEKGIKIDGEHLSHLLFADDIVIIAQSPEELEGILNDIHTTSQPVGLNMHLGKTKVMFNEFATKSPITVDGNVIEEVDSYVYLGKTVTQDGDLLPEVKRRIALGWAAFGRVDNIMKSRTTSMKIKQKVFNEYVLPVMTYGSETWALNKAVVDRLAVAQRKMERIMLGIRLRDRQRNTWIREQTGVEDIIVAIKKSKHRWAGHIARMTDNRWTKRVTEWTPRDWTRGRGRPNTRWRDDLIRHMGPTWGRLAQDRCQWIQFREGFLLRE